MRTLRLFFIMAATCLVGSFASAQEFTWTQGLTQQQILNEMVASSKYRPKKVVNLEAFEIPIFLDGKPVGSVKVNPGTPLDVVSVKPDGVTVDINGSQTKLAIDKTDLLSRFETRKKEVDQEKEEALQALIAEGKEIYVVPPKPVVIVEAPVNETIYVDDSSRRDRVSSGNYWPYTGGYYPYPTTYVIQPAYYPVNYYQNPYYCYRSANPVSNVTTTARPVTSVPSGVRNVNGVWRNAVGTPQPPPRP